MAAFLHTRTLEKAWSQSVLTRATAAASVRKGIGFRNNKPYQYLITISGLICSHVLIKSVFFVETRLVRTDIIQGILVGFGLAITTAYMIGRIKSISVYGWRNMPNCGDAANGMFLRVACTLAFPGPINVRQEAMYWTAADTAVPVAIVMVRLQVNHSTAC